MCWGWWKQQSDTSQQGCHMRAMCWLRLHFSGSQSVRAVIGSVSHHTGHYSTSTWKHTRISILIKYKQNIYNMLMSEVYRCWQVCYFRLDRSRLALSPLLYVFMLSWTTLFWLQLSTENTDLRLESIFSLSGRKWIYIFSKNVVLFL